MYGSLDFFFSKVNLPVQSAPGQDTEHQYSRAPVSWKATVSLTSKTVDWLIMFVILYQRNHAIFCACFLSLNIQ